MKVVLTEGFTLSYRASFLKKEYIYIYTYIYYIYLYSICSYITIFSFINLVIQYVPISPIPINNNRLLYLLTNACRKCMLPVSIIITFDVCNTVQPISFEAIEQSTTQPEVYSSIFQWCKRAAFPFVWLSYCCIKKKKKCIV